MGAYGKSSLRFTTIDAWAIALGCIIGWGAFVMPGSTFLPEAGPAGTAIALAVGTCIMLAIAANFHFMANRYPENGGAFIFAYKTFGMNHGFGCAWALALAYISIIPQNATALVLIIRSLFGNLLEVGFHYNISGFDIYAGESAVVVLVLAIVCVLFFTNSSLVRIAQTLFAICLVVAAAAVVSGIALHPATSIESLQPPFNPDASPVAGILAILAIAPWAFVGFDAVSQVSGEAAFSLRKSGAIMAVAILIGAAIYISFNAAAACATPPGYAGWDSYVAAIPSLTGLESLPLFFTTSDLLGSAGLVLLGIAALAAALTGIVGFFIAGSRLLYTMALEGVLSEFFKKLHPKYGTPKNIILLIFATSIVASLFGRTVLGWIVDISAVGASVGFLYTSAAVWRIAKGESKGAWCLLGGLGVVFSLGFMLLLLVPNPLLGSSLEVESYVFMFAWAALGFNFFTPSYRPSQTKLPPRDDVE